MVFKKNILCLYLAPPALETTRSHRLHLQYHGNRWGLAHVVTPETLPKIPNTSQVCVWWGICGPGLKSVSKAELVQWLGVLSPTATAFISRGSAFSNPTSRGFYSLQASGIHFQVQFPLLAAAFAVCKEFRAKCLEILCVFTCVWVCVLQSCHPQNLPGHSKPTANPHCVVLAPSQSTSSTTEC